MAKKLILFNHKGGVSKTTTTFHLAWLLAEKGSRVLVVDATTQCDLTWLFLGDDFDAYYENEKTRLHNIKDGVAPAFEGGRKLIQAIDAVPHPHNEKLFLIPGHTDLTEYESSLSIAFSTYNTFSVLQDLPGALGKLIDETAKAQNIDWILIDMNPALSVINQNLFLLCDYFIIPTNSDPFSVQSIKTLAKFLPKWKRNLERVRGYYEDARYPLPHGETQFLGWIAQGFNIRGGVATDGLNNRFQEIENVIETEAIPAFQNAKLIGPVDSSSSPKNYCLAEIPNSTDFLIEKFGKFRKPIYALTQDELSKRPVVLHNVEGGKNKVGEIFDKLSDYILTLNAVIQPI